MGTDKKIIITSTPKGIVKSVDMFMNEWFRLWQKEHRKLKLTQLMEGFEK